MNIEKGEVQSGNRLHSDNGGWRTVDRWEARALAMDGDMVPRQNEKVRGKIEM